MTIETILTPAEISLLDQRDLSDAYCVVFDVLRATSSIVTAMAHGAEAVLPVSEVSEAVAAAKWERTKHGDTRRILLAGERGGDRIEGFDLGNSPSEFTDCADCRIVTTTTNGTVALRACRGGARVVAGSLLNLAAVTADIRSVAPQRLFLVCAGTHERVALEDVYAAGRLLTHLDMDAGGDDASALALSAAQRFGDDAISALGHAENGRALRAAHRSDDILWAARESIYACLPTMQTHGWLTL